MSARDFIDNVLLKIGFELNTNISPDRFPAFLCDDRARWKEAVSQINPAKFKTRALLRAQALGRGVRDPGARKSEAGDGSGAGFGRDQCKARTARLGL